MRTDWLPPTAWRPPASWRHPWLHDLGFAVVPWARALRGREQTAIEQALDGLVHPTHEVLEVGSGTGWYTGAIADRARRVRAVEPAPAMRARLTRKMTNAGHGNVSAHDGRLPLDPGVHPPADGIVCIGVLDYLDDLVVGLASFAENLRPDGWVLCTVPAGSERGARRRHLPHQAPSFGRNRDEFLVCADAAGLHVTAMTTVSLRGRPRTLIATLRPIR